MRKRKFMVCNKKILKLHCVGEKVVFAKAETTSLVILSGPFSCVR